MSHANGGIIREVLEKRAIHVVFQPLVALGSPLHTFAFETLVRSDHPAFRSPPELIEAAVEEGCIGELGRLIRELAVKGCPDHPLFLNIDPNEFDQEFLVQPDDPMFSHPHEVFLEITESVPLSHYELCHSVLNELRRRSIRLAVDDLGAGYSNLKYIADLAPDIVKLDRELIQNLEVGTRLHRLVDHISDLCVGLGAKVVAEGVETVDELRAVQSAGVHYVQGWFFARPAAPPPMIDAQALVDSAQHP